MLKQRRYDQKTKFDIEFSKAHNSHKTFPFFFGILRIEVFYSFLLCFLISLQDLFIVDLDLDLKI